jgi:hypothetical protein
MGNPKWRASVGVARASSATEEPAAPVIFPIFDGGANTTEEPIIVERPASWLRDVDYIWRAGFNHAFTIPGITPDPNTMGYLLWLALGGDAYDTGVHTITPALDQQYLNVFLDYLLDIEPGAGTDPVKRIIGGKITEFTIEQAAKQPCKLSLQGVACNRGEPLASVSPSIPTGADNAPLHWAHLQDDSGYFKVGLNGAALAEDTTIQGFKIGYRSPPIFQAPTLASNQPSGLYNGMREVTFGFEKDFHGANATAQVDAFMLEQAVAIEARWQIGTNYVVLTIPAGSFTAYPLSDVGPAEEMIRLIVEAKAYYDGTNSVISGSVKDGSVALYT